MDGVTSNFMQLMLSVGVDLASEQLWPGMVLMRPFGEGEASAHKDQPQTKTAMAVKYFPFLSIFTPFVTTEA